MNETGNVRLSMGSVRVRAERLYFHGKRGKHFLAIEKSENENVFKTGENRPESL